MLTKILICRHEIANGFVSSNNTADTQIRWNPARRSNNLLQAPPINPLSPYSGRGQGWGFFF